MLKSFLNLGKMAQMKTEIIAGITTFMTICISH